MNVPVADTALIAWVSLATMDVDTVGILPTEQVIMRDVGGTLLPARFAWGVKPLWKPGLGGLVHVPNGEYRIEILEVGGQLRHEITWSGPDREITDQEWDQLFARRDSIVALEPREASMIPNRDEHPRPPKPVAREVFVDEEGRIWLEVFQVPWLVEPPSRQIWWVFAQSGEWLAEITTPPRFQLRSVSRDYMLGITRDALDRELLARIPLEVPAG